MRSFSKHFLPIAPTQILTSARGNPSTATKTPHKYSDQTTEALNQFSKYTKDTPTNMLDLRCEFDLPRFVDLTKPESDHEEENFIWFHTAHEFQVPSAHKTEILLRQTIL